MASGDISDKFVFFWQKDSPFSQFHPCEFIVDGITYNCAEQFMMHQKAVLFGDKESAADILSEHEPMKIKSLGRNVSNFDEEVWEKERVGIVKRGNTAKFSQNKELKDQLFATAPRLLVEASPFDRIWGIGLKADNPKAKNKSSWRGTNLLGYALTEVRDNLIGNRT